MSEYVNFYIGNRKEHETECSKICWTGDSYSRNSAVFQIFRKTIGENIDDKYRAKRVTVENLQEIILALKVELSKNIQQQRVIDKRISTATDKYYNVAKSIRTIYETYKTTKDFVSEEVIDGIEKGFTDALRDYMSKYNEENQEELNELQDDEEELKKAINFYEAYLSRIEYNNLVYLYAGIEAINPDGSDDFVDDLPF